MTAINALEKPLLQIASKLQSSFMADLDQYLVPYLLSQGVSFVVLFAASQNTKVARALFALMFLGGSVTNLYNGIMQPEVYLEYGKLALPFYRDFINGWFGHNSHILIPLIALGQLAIGVGMSLKGSPVKWACRGAIIFFIGIAPLMIGSAFPFSVTVSVATLVILARDDYEYLWRKRPNFSKSYPKFFRSDAVDRSRDSSCC